MHVLVSSHDSDRQSLPVLHVFPSSQPVHEVPPQSIDDCMCECVCVYG